MEVDIAAAYDAMVERTSQPKPVSEGMIALLDYCSQIYPSHLWASLHGLDYAHDEAQLREWLTSVLTDEPATQSIKAYWFGLYNPILDDAVSCGLYISGSTHDYSLDNLDWACWREDSYLPVQRYAPSSILHEIYRTVQQDENITPFKKRAALQ